MIDVPELKAALEAHGLRTDKPSQLSDAFRLGWNTRADLSDAKDARIAELEAQRDALIAADAEWTRLMLGTQKRMWQYKTSAEAAEAKLAVADDMAGAMKAILKMMDKTLQGTGLGDMAIKPDHSMSLSDAWKFYSAYKRARATLKQLKGAADG